VEGIRGDNQRGPRLDSGMVWKWNVHHNDMPSFIGVVEGIILSFPSLSEAALGKLVPTLPDLPPRLAGSARRVYRGE
jgi:hypothetical protein